MEVTNINPPRITTEPGLSLNSSMKWGNKKSSTNKCRGFCDRDRIQTCNRLIRSQLLYSVELRDPIHIFFSDRDRIQTCNRLIRSQLLYSVELRDLLLNKICDRDRIQTCNRLIRSQLLYSVELRDHCFVLTGAKIRTFPEIASVSTFFCRKIIL